MRAHSLVLVTGLLAFTILATSASAQMDYCHFPKPVRVIRPSTLPRPILDALRNLGQYSTDTNNNAAPVLFFAGRLNDFYFSWSDVGNAVKITLVSLFHLKPQNEVEVLEGGWPGFGGFAESCRITKGLLDKFTVPSQKSSMVKSQDAIASPPPLIPYPPISQRLGEQGTTELAVNMGSDGMVTDVAISQSSGSNRLDDAAVKYIKEHYRRPSLEDGKSGAAQVTVVVVWRLDTPDDKTTIMPRADYPPGAEIIEIHAPHIDVRE
jgi:TonB family protein